MTSCECATETATVLPEHDVRTNDQAIYGALEILRASVNPGDINPRLVANHPCVERIYDSTPVPVDCQSVECALCQRTPSVHADITEAEPLMNSLEDVITEEVGTEESARNEAIAEKGGVALTKEEKERVETIYDGMREDEMAEFEDGRNVAVCDYCLDSEGCELVTCANCGEVFAFVEGKAAIDGGVVTCNVLGKTKTFCKDCAKRIVADCDRCGFRDQLVGIHVKDCGNICINCTVDYGRATANHPVSLPKEEIAGMIEDLIVAKELKIKGALAEKCDEDFGSTVVLPPAEPLGVSSDDEDEDEEEEEIFLPSGKRQHGEAKTAEVDKRKKE